MQISEMSDRQLQEFKRYLKQRIERRQRVRKIAGAAFLALYLMGATILSYNALSPKASEGYKYYTSITIKPGDTLWDIANEYIDSEHYKNQKEYMDEVKSINHLEDDNLKAGQIIVVPYYSSKFIW